MSLEFQTLNAPPPEGTPKEVSFQEPIINDDGNAAAMELWDLIHAPKSLFQHAQRNRTLCHPSLPQPTSEEELRHLTLCQESSEEEDQATSSNVSKSKSASILKSSTSSKSLVTSTMSLEERLAHALDRAGIGSSSSKNLPMKEHPDSDPYLNSSPTSTLQFPVEPEIRSKSPVVFPKNGMTRTNSQDFFWDYAASDEYDEPTHSLEWKPSSNNTNETTLPQNSYQEKTNTHVVSEMEQHSDRHTFVVCADTQLGTVNQNKEWNTELEYIDKAVDIINNMKVTPSFVSVCGDLVEMEGSIYTNKKGSPYSMEQCHVIQDKQNQDFKRAWSKLDGRIPLICMCGNHDVGNRPTRKSIDRFKAAFGDEYLAYWTNGTYNIVMNNVLFNDPTGAPDLFEEQIEWLEDRLKYANQHCANQIFVFAHHPWFLYNEHENQLTMQGKSILPEAWGEGDIGDGYFSIPREYRKIALDLFKKYHVSASFSGHFHQNVVSKTDWGMDMIITGPLSVTLESDGKPEQKDKNGNGIRIVEVQGKGFEHYFENFDTV